MVNMSARFNGEAYKGLVSIVFTRSKCAHGRMHGTTASFLYTLRNALCRDKKQELSEENEVGRKETQSK